MEPSSYEPFVVFPFQESGASFFRISNHVGMEMILSCRGAGLAGLFFQGKPMMMSHLDLSDWASPNGEYAGKTIGPLAGRVKDYSFIYQGRAYTLPKDPRSPKHALHGGALCYGERDFDVDISKQGQELNVHFHQNFNDPDYPSPVSVEVDYLLDLDEPCFRLILSAKAKEGAPINLTHHAYWNLGGYPNVLNHRLTFSADQVADYDPDLLLLGLKKTPKILDFSEGKALTPLWEENELKITNGIDHGFALKEKTLILESPAFRMKMETSAPAIQMYLMSYPRKNLKLQSGEWCMMGSGLAIEPQGALTPEPSEHQIAPSETFRIETNYCFETL